MRFVAIRLLAILGALLGWATLGAEAWLTYGQKGEDAGAAAWYFIAFFTDLTNLLAAVLLTHAAIRPRYRAHLGDPRLELAVASSMVFLAIVYALFLENPNDPLGPRGSLQAWVDISYHRIMPGLFTLFWLVRSHGGLRWRDTLWALVWPGIYLAYAFSRGAFDGFYPYWFLDAAKVAAGQLARNIGAMMAGAVVVGFLFVVVDRLLARKLPAR